MAELSGSQPSGPTQSSLFNPGRPPPPQEGDFAARNTEEKFVWVMRRRGGQQRGQTMDYRCRYCNSAQARGVVGEWGADEMIIDDHPFIVLTETKFSFRCIPVWIGTLL
jgi:hypothetical protein